MTTRCNGTQPAPVKPAEKVVLPSMNKLCRPGVAKAPLIK